MKDGRAGAPGSRSEARVLLAACSVEPLEIRADRLRSILESAAPDWGFLLENARENRVLLQLHEVLSAAEPEGVPAAIHAALEKEAGRIKLHNLGMLREFVEVVGLLEDRGMTPIPLKGPLLAFEFYGDVTHRQFADLDLLVGTDRVFPAVELLEAHGYQAASPLWPTRRGQLLEEDCEMDLISAEKGIRVELHWELLPPRHADGFHVDSLRRGLRSLSMMGRTYRTLSAVDLLLYLCVHGGDKHLWARLRWLCDVARFIARGEPDWNWEEVLARAAKIRRLRALLLGAYLAWHLLDAPLPDEVLERATRDPAVGARAGIVGGRLFQAPARMPSYEEWCLEVEAAREKVRSRGLHLPPRPKPALYLRTILTPEWTDRQAILFPRPLSFLYYLYRPLRLLGKHKVEAFRRV